MNRLLTILLITNFIWACNSHRYSDNKEAIDSGKADHHQHEIISENLVLNNGVKWKADNTTNNNVKYLLAIIEEFNNGTAKSLSADKKVADDLQKGLDKMIGECKMQGRGHDALHRWLEPLIEQVAKLRQASTEADAAKSLEAIHAQVSLYAQYFEL